MYARKFYVTNLISEFRTGNGMVKFMYRIARVNGNRLRSTFEREIVPLFLT